MIAGNVEGALSVLGAVGGLDTLHAEPLGGGRRHSYGFGGKLFWRVR